MVKPALRSSVAARQNGTVLFLWPIVRKVSLNVYHQKNFFSVVKHSSRRAVEAHFSFVVHNKNTRHLQAL
jgi:hypothetical protein